MLSRLEADKARGQEPGSSYEETIIELEKCKLLPDELKRYLLAKYSQEPFPHEYSEQDLHTSIVRDLQAYDSGELDVTVKSPSERWQEEREYLHKLYDEKAHEARELQSYILELEHMLFKHGLESLKMAKRRFESEDPMTF